ncbi:hypothetical protein BSL82_17975 (plasmid) [Tardibacter chloracetimidivorans]|uniref:Uncharacterized protein n=1 Tax=Tardibacter chloracetimidivorans TaxID=1921510 RepID=A0A1L4A0D0_9SPHN|nr:hypothetical protein BSL82_17975 [Tardibacter chloracetimidivorans]
MLSAMIENRPGATLAAKKNRCFPGFPTMPIPRLRGFRRSWTQIQPSAKARKQPPHGHCRFVYANQVALNR